MITFKFNNFCFTVNQTAITHILWGASSIAQEEKQKAADLRKTYMEELHHHATEPKSHTSILLTKGIRTNFANPESPLQTLKRSYSDSMLNYTLISIKVNGSSIDISAKALLSVVNKLKDFEEDFDKYVAVSDFISYIDFKLGYLDSGCVDFSSSDCLKEFYNHIKDSVNSRKRYITKMITLKHESSVNIPDYLIYYNCTNGNYVVPNDENKEKSIFDNLTL